MKNILFLVFLFCGLSGTLRANPAQGDWELHLAYHDGTQVVSAGTTLYALLNGNLLAYDTEDTSVRTFDKLTGLSDKGIRYVGYSETQKCLVLYYENNNVDFLYEDGSVVNVPQVKNYIEYSVVPRNFNVCGDWASIATTEGVVVLNIPRAEIKGYYRIRKSVSAAVVLGQDIFISTDKEILKGSLADNLYDFSQWTALYDFPAKAFVPFGGGAYLLVPRIAGLSEAWSGLCYMGPAATNVKNPLTRMTDASLVGGSAWNNHIQFVGSNLLITVNGEEPLKEVMRIPLISSQGAIAYTADGTYWAVGKTGKIENYVYESETSSLKDTGVQVGGFGPRRDLCYNLTQAGGRLMVSGGRMDYAAGKNYPATAMIYENGEWSSLPEEGFALNDHALYRNVLSMAQHPEDPSRLFVATTSGLVEFKDNEFANHYNSSNSLLQIAAGGGTSPNYTIVDGLSFDTEGNLWMTNYESDDPIKVFKKDGTWKGFTDASFNDVATPEKSLVDRSGRVWVTSRRTTSSTTSGLYALDCNGTLDDESDDKSRFRSSAVNEDGTTCNLEYVKDICEDMEGQIWLGCKSGVYAVTQPEDWFSSSFSIYQPKVPRNDGTNFADYLLTGIDVTAIVVDGGNRKWLGTMGSGIYLVSPDGSEVIEHLTAADTPLLSDNIFSLALNPINGELMVGTDLGLCTYRTHIMPPVDKLSKGAVKVYPNPVRPEYHGNVTVTGLTAGAEVKVVTSGSQLVARGNAVGGTFIWNVCSEASGCRVAPGVYYLLISDADGSDSVAAKVVVI